jgi:hypothetical protein
MVKCEVFSGNENYNVNFILGSRNVAILFLIPLLIMRMSSRMGSKGICKGIFCFSSKHVLAYLTERKEKLSEVEQQLKKAEAAQRRKMQVEKAANEIQVCMAVWVGYNCGISSGMYFS